MSEAFYFEIGSFWTLFYLLFEWSIRVIMLVIVPFRRSPDAAKGWLLSVFFLPVPALVLYILIGRPSYPRWRRMRFARLHTILERATHQISRLEACRPPILPSNLLQAATLIKNLGQFPTLAGNNADLLSDYNGLIDRLIADIDAAQDHVHLVVYIFADDDTGRRVIQALVGAVRRGATCRVLIDALGSRQWSRRVLEALTAGGVTAHLALPVGLLRRRNARADLRNHRKIFVIDSRIGYAGSQNIVDANVTNEELVARVTGPVVLELQAVFAADWFLETEQVLNIADLFPHHHPGSGMVAQVLPSGPDYPTAGVENLMVGLIHGARERVVITTPYFIPDEALLRALQTAVLRGVDVRLVVSRRVDQVLVGFAQRSYYEELLEAGIRLHLYRSRLLHAKHFSIDGEIMLIGSSNVDIRSFLLNAEVSLIFYDKDVTGRLRLEQERTFASSDLLTLPLWRDRFVGIKVCENLARLMSPLL